MDCPLVGCFFYLFLGPLPLFRGLFDFAIWFRAGAAARFGFSCFYARLRLLLPRASLSLELTVALLVVSTRLCFIFRQLQHTTGHADRYYFVSWEQRYDAHGEHGFFGRCIAAPTGIVWFILFAVPPVLVWLFWLHALYILAVLDAPTRLPRLAIRRRLSRRLLARPASSTGVGVGFLIERRLLCSAVEAWLGNLSSGYRFQSTLVSMVVGSFWSEWLYNFADALLAYFVARLHPITCVVCWSHLEKRRPSAFCGCIQLHT